MERRVSRRSARLVLRGARAAEAAREAARRFRGAGTFFFTDTLEYDAAAVDKHLRAPGWSAISTALDAALAALDTFDPASTEAALRAVADARGVKAAVAHPRRTGRGDRKSGKPRALRGARSARPRPRARAARGGRAAAVDLAFLIAPFFFHRSTC